MMLGSYILRGTKPIPCDDTLEWGKWMEDEGKQDIRRVGKTIFPLDGGGCVRVSTVFLGLDHNYRGSGPPILFETMIFAGDDPNPDEDGDSSFWSDLHQERYSTYLEALEGHHAVCRQIAERLNQKEIDHADLRRLGQGG